ncbi:MAG: isoprenylcysteine carboxylmethyltransferase family protein [Abitibacteriaceae bacterium]|nr:isoprenylcysteine carboxylmethyltransferase family protein [Abditibacteriaceae bacterium]
MEELPVGSTTGQSADGVLIEGTHEKVRRTITSYRVPLVTLGALAVIMFMHDKRAFLYGMPVTLFGELIQVWAASQLHKDQHFTVSGPYSHVRNPMYTGRFFMSLGFFIMTGNLWLIAAFVILFAAYGQMRVAREERRLEVIFAPHYQHYCSEINRWVPRLKPYSRSEAKNANWSQVRYNNEHLIFAGVVAVLFIVFLRIEYFPNYYWGF